MLQDKLHVSCCPFFRTLKSHSWPKATHARSKTWFRYSQNCIERTIAIVHQVIIGTVSYSSCFQNWEGETRLTSTQIAALWMGQASFKICARRCHSLCVVFARSAHWLACDQQTYFRSSVLTLRKIAIFRRERSDNRKCVCRSQATLWPASSPANSRCPIELGRVCCDVISQLAVEHEERGCLLASP